MNRSNSKEKEPTEMRKTETEEGWLCNQNDIRKENETEQNYTPFLVVQGVLRVVRRRRRRRRREGVGGGGAKKEKNLH